MRIQGQVWETVIVVTGLSLVGSGCEPTSVADAREQLGRGGSRFVEFTVPVADTVFQVQTLLDAEGAVLDTLSDGTLAVGIDPESLSVAVGERLEFDDVPTDSLVVSFDPAVFAAPPGTQVTFSSSYDVLAVGVRFPDIDTTVVHDGVLVVTSKSRLTADVEYEITLNGFVGPTGAPLVQSAVIPAAPGDGSYQTSDLIFNLSGVTITPSNVRVDVAGEATLGDPMNPSLADSAIVQFGSGDVALGRLVGRPDPNEVPELNVAVQEIHEMPQRGLSFADLEDAVREARINSATIELVLENESDLPAASSDLTVGLVQLDAFGSVPRDAAGEIVYEVDSAGVPILIPIADSGQTTFSLARASTMTLELPAAPLLDRLVNLLLDDVRAALVTSGRVSLGDGNAGGVARTDRVQLRFDASVALDLTVPESGVTFTRTTSQDGLLSLSETNADQLADRVVSASVSTDVENRTPFGVELEIAFVQGDLPENADVFSEPGRVLLTGITVDAPAVDARGRVMEATESTVEIELFGQDVRPLLTDRFTAGVRARLMPGAGADGRGAIGATDGIVLDSRARIQLQAGGSQ